MFYHYSELPSTIDEAKSDKYLHGDVIVADYQSAGRGQRGRTWISVPGENLLFSVVLDTSFLRAENQFLLLQTVALALIDMLAVYGLEARVKWTNDIYVADRKIVGVLIDHSLGSHGMLRCSGVGVGINVNSQRFDPALPNPTSMMLELRHALDRQEVLEQFYTLLMTRFETLRSNNFGDLQSEYNLLLYRVGQRTQFSRPDGTTFLATIHGVAPSGELLLEHEDGTRRGYSYGEISLII